MEERCMEITLISARDLKDTTIFSKTKAYAAAWISNDRKGKQRTPVDRYNATNPIWNHVINFTLNEADLQQGRLDLEIAIYRNAVVRDKEIGHVSIPLNEFLKPRSSRNGASASAKFVSNELRWSSRKSKGFLNISMKFSEKPEVEQQQPQGVAGSYGASKVESMTGYSAGPDRAGKAEPVTAYPGYPPNSSSSYPPANNQYPPTPYPPANNQYPPPPYPPQAPYTPPPPYFQGYPPNQGYPAVVPTEQQMYRQNNKLGMGLGVGLVGGALGGLLIRDIIGDAYYDDGGYDGGFDDGGDFQLVSLCNRPPLLKDGGFCKL